MNKFRRNAFTLMETLVTIVILGIVATILVPNLINRQVENANRTRIKKAMASYEKAINYIIIENDIRTTEGIREFGEDDNCKSVRGYFKTVQDGVNDCIFKTADRVWWNITDLTNPIIILKDSQKDKTMTELKNLARNLSDMTVFALIGRFDDLGTLRVNDNGFEQSLTNNINNRKYMAKLWGFINNTTFNILSEFDICKQNNQTTCTIEVDGEAITYKRVQTTSDTVVDKFRNGSALCVYDRETKESTCGYTVTAPAGDYWISDSLGKLSESEAKSEETCNASIYENCETNGDYYEAAKLKCEKFGGHIANLAELKLSLSYIPVGWYKSSEEIDSETTYEMATSGATYRPSKSENMPSICVGNK